MLIELMSSSENYCSFRTMQSKQPHANFYKRWIPSTVNPHLTNPFIMDFWYSGRTCQCRYQLAPLTRPLGASPSNTILHPSSQTTRSSWRGYCCIHVIAPGDSIFTTTDKTFSVTMEIPPLLPAAASSCHRLFIRSSLDCRLLLQSRRYISLPKRQQMREPQRPSMSCRWQQPEKKRCPQGLQHETQQPCHRTMWQVKKGHLVQTSGIGA